MTADTQCKKIETLENESGEFLCILERDHRGNHEYIGPDGNNFTVFPVKRKGDDPVNHPKHYTSDPSGVECIQITRHRNFNIGNAIKYLWRAGLKDSQPTIQELDKAIWYIEDEKKRLLGEY